MSEETKQKIGQSKKGVYSGAGFKKGHVPWNKGKMSIHLSPTSEFKKGCIPWNKGKECPKGELAPHWKGKNVGYQGLHGWLRKHIGKPDHCDLCGIIEQPNGLTKNYFEWSCRTGIYTRDLDNWWQLCKKCHKNYDMFFLRKKEKSDERREVLSQATHRDLQECSDR